MPCVCCRGFHLCTFYSSVFLSLTTRQALWGMKSYSTSLCMVRKIRAALKRYAFIRKGKNGRIRNKHCFFSVTPLPTYWTCFSIFENLYVLVLVYFWLIAIMCRIFCPLFKYICVSLPQFSVGLSWFCHVKTFSPCDKSLPVNFIYSPAAVTTPLCMLSFLF